LVHTESSLVLNLDASFTVGGTPNLTNTSDDVPFRKNIYDGEFYFPTLAGEKSGEGKTYALFYQIIPSVHSYSVGLLI
jgi:hypothetical protein